MRKLKHNVSLFCHVIDFTVSEEELEDALGLECYASSCATLTRYGVTLALVAWCDGVSFA